jgi:ribonuclease HII
MAAFEVGVVVRRLKEIDHYERQLRDRGVEAVAGVDEAGRGALAGPLVAAAVILPAEFDLDGVEDSKLLTPKQRREAFDRITSGAVCWSVCKAMPARIDRNGMHRTNMSLLRRALKKLETSPEFVLCDGFPLKRLPMPSVGVRKGDVVSASIAAASILAKVTRDRIMDRYHRRFPDYGFRTNKGYGTEAHWEALWRLGPTPIHRRSFNHVLHPLSPEEYRRLKSSKKVVVLEELEEAPR